MNGTSRNVALRKFRPDLLEVFWGGSSLKVSFSVFFLVSPEFSVFFSKDLRVLAFKSRFSEFIKETQVIYIKLCEENIIKTGCVTTYMYVTVSLLLCPAYSFVQFFLLSLATSPIWFWHSKLKGLIRLRFSHIVEVLGLDFQTRALASSCVSLWFYHSPPQRMLSFPGLPHRIYISKIKWVEQCSLPIQLS